MGVMRSPPKPLVSILRLTLGLVASAHLSIGHAGGFGFLPPNLKIAKSHVGSFSQGQVGATYSIVVSSAPNSLPGVFLPTNGPVTVVDMLPASLTASAIGGPGWSCTLATLTCVRADVLNQGQSYPPIVLTVDVSASAPASVTNTATVSGGGENPDFLSDNTASDTTAITQVPADLSIAKTHSGTFVQGQADATYGITVSNAGPGATAGTVTVVDTLPAALNPTAIFGSGWACTLLTLTCTRSDVLAPGANYPTIVLVVDVSISAPASVINVATVSGGGDATPANGTASDVTAITKAPEIAQQPVPSLGGLAICVLATLLALAGAAALRRS